MFKRAEREFSEFNFEVADTARLFEHFGDAEAECQTLIGRGIALPAYDQCLKASHLFNLLDARGVISVTERAAYIGRVRALARACCETWLAVSRDSVTMLARTTGTAIAQWPGLSRRSTSRRSR